MVFTTDPETKSPGEVESCLECNEEQECKNQPAAFQSLGRQSSVYSLTLDEFQNTICEGGKTFGSMNMDEFLNSIWTAEDNQAQTNVNVQFPRYETNKGLPRQGSLSVPEPLCRKTVDEVWLEIRKDGVENRNPAAQRQRTFGEMTLEDFLVRAGVVREASYAGYRSSNQQEMGIGTFQSLPQSGTGVGETSCYPSRTKRGGGGHASAVSTFSGGFGQVQAGVGIGSPVSSDGLCVNQADSGIAYGIDGPVERVVERRQRRMIKNRESAARSRARKQAYTVELEAELNHLKEENQLLKQALAQAHLERKRKQQYYEEAKVKKVRMQSKAQKAKEKLTAMRRSSSCPY